MDLVGRKLGKDGGRAVMAFFNEVTSFLKESASDEGLAGLLKPVETALGHLQQATMWFMQNALARPDNAGRRRHRLHAYVRPRRARLYVGEDRQGGAGEAEAGADGEAARMAGKLATAKFFMQRMLPETAAQLARITSGADSVMALPAEAF